jgi:hypothetical protein
MHDNNNDQYDDDLRARFRLLEAEAGAAAPELSAARINDWRSELLMQSRRSWRVGTVVGVAAGGVVMLTVGLVLGASTGYASAEVIIKERGDTPLPPAPAFAVLKNISPLMFSCASPPPRVAELPKAQQGVPIVDLPEPTTKTPVVFGGVLGVRVLSNGNVLVNDAGRRQMHLFDSSLTRSEIVRDSAAGSSVSYGPRAQRLLKWVGDSSLVGDYQGGTLLVLGPSGQVARVMAPLDMFMTASLSVGDGEADDKGRLLYNSKPLDDLALGLGRAKIPDSALLVRADFETRRIDTLARIKSSGNMKLLGRVGDGPVRFFTEPVPLTDGWAQLSDGSIAVVRGHDYHVDWIAPDGSTRSGSKMPFDWKRYTDEEKQQIIDSIKTVAAARLGNALGQRRVEPPPNGEPPRAGGRVAGSGVAQGPPLPMEYIAPDLKDVFDFHPPLRRGAVMPDLDGNVWILPTSSAQSKKGELVYDVTNAKGEFYRVRMPVGRSLAGFGKGGVVFLLNGDRTTGFYLEKVKLPSLPGRR